MASKNTIAKVIRYHVKNLDVWGHAPGSLDCDCPKDKHGDPECGSDGPGFWINDMSCAGHFDLPATRTVYNAGTAQQFDSWGSTDAEILAAMVEAGYLREGADAKVEIEDGDGYGFCVYDKERHKPLYQVEYGKDD